MKAPKKSQFARIAPVGPSPPTPTCASADDPLPVATRAAVTELLAQALVADLRKRQAALSLSRSRALPPPTGVPPAGSEAS